jgi:RadC-like JAB domain
MSKSKTRTAIVAYEDPKADRKEAAYLAKVRRSLDDMGAPNSGELIHNSGAYLTGVYRGGVSPETAASVLWHRHCEAGGSRTTPCVAEMSECPPQGGAPAPMAPSASDPRAVALLALAEAKSGIRAMRGPTGLAVWTLPGSNLEIMWSGPGSRLFIGQATKPGGHVSSIDHHTANGNYDTFKQADAAVAAFLAVGDPTRLEANDSAPSGQPFTRLERQESAAPEREIELSSDRAIYDYLAPYLHAQNQEVILVLGLDLHHCLKSNTEVARGQVDRVAVSVEDVLAPAIASRPAGFVLVHNHPSGQADPSDKDRELTDRVKAGVEVSCPETVFLDHLVIGKNEYFSFTDNQLKRVEPA